MTPPAHRLASLPIYPLALLSQRVRELASAGCDIINLDVGSPDMPPPDHVIARLAQAAAQPHKHAYAGYKGSPEFRRAVALYYQRRFGVTVDPETQVLPLIGSKEGIVNLSLAYLDRGDLALVPNIGYPAYAMGAHLAGGDVFWIPVSSTVDLLPSIEMIPSDAAQRAKLLWLNYPSNPTGAVVDLSFYERMLAFCREYDILLASDNPYCDVTYNGYNAPSALQVSGALDHAIEFTSFSKTYNMAGWRLGAAVGSAAAIATLLQVKSNMDSGHFLPIYDAGIAAIEDTPPEWIEARNQTYQRRRDRIVDMLPRIGLQGTAPQGALYIWAKVQQHGSINDGDSYAQMALEEAHVSVAPGSIYGPGGQAFVRISLTVPDARLHEALDRLALWWNRLSS